MPRVPLKKTEFVSLSCNGQLPVLTRFFPKDLVTSPDQPLPVAKYLDLILYSREQINKVSCVVSLIVSMIPRSLTKGCFR
jgi:Protein of unknown function (DUF3228)